MKTILTALVAVVFLFSSSAISMADEIRASVTLTGHTRLALVELGMYIQSGQIRSASILADGHPFYTNDDPSPVSATAWIVPRDEKVTSVGDGYIPVKSNIEQSLTNVPTEALIIILFGTCDDLSVFGEKSMYASPIHTYTFGYGKTDILAVVKCPE